MGTSKLVSAKEVCETVGITDATLSAWYRFKAETPDSELAQLLPDIIRVGPRNARFWKAKDVSKLTKFKLRVPKGCHGVMGSITQKYVKKKTED